MPFNFNAKCLVAFERLKKNLIMTPIIVTPNWSLDFELNCDASHYSIGAILGQRKDKIFTQYIMLVKYLMIHKLIMQLQKKNY
jgi:hypothetical protein